MEQIFYEKAKIYLEAAILYTESEIKIINTKNQINIDIVNQKPNEIKASFNKYITEAINNLKKYNLTSSENDTANNFIIECITMYNQINAIKSMDGSNSTDIIKDKIVGLIIKIKSLEPKKTVQEYMVEYNIEKFKFFIDLINITDYEKKLNDIKPDGTNANTITDIKTLLNILKNNNTLIKYKDTSKQHTIVELHKDIAEFEELVEVIRIFGNIALKQLIKESIMGAVRTLLRIKPYKLDSISLLKKNFNNGYVNGLIEYQNYNFTQNGGYNYEDVISITSENKLVIDSKNCNTNPNGYGPFAAIYPPQSDNIAIYKNLFFSETDKTDGKAIIKALKIADNPNNITKPFNSITIQQQLLMDKLNRNQTVVIFGYGMSGSGKTYVLIEGFKDINNKIYDPSILEQFVKQTTDVNCTNKLSSVEFTEIYPYGEVKDKKDLEQDYDISNPDVNYETGIKRTEKVIKFFTITPDQIKEYCEELNINIVKFTDLDDLYATINENLTFEYISLRIRLIERHRIKHMRILPTPNNGKSSRSFFQITLKLGTGGKLVLFDMPGTENTVRIKTEFIGEQLFTDILDTTQSLKQVNTTDGNLKQGKYKLEDFEVHVHESTSTTTTTTPEFIKVTTTETTKTNTGNNYYDILFKVGSLVLRKDFIAFGITFVSGANDKNDKNVKNVLVEYHDSIIGKVSHDLTMFLNGKEGKFIDMPINTPLFFLTNDLATKLFTTFLKYLATSENDNGKIKHSFCSTVKQNDCQIPLRKVNKIYLDETDKEQIQKIFGFVVTIIDSIEAPKQPVLKSTNPIKSNSTNTTDLPTIIIVNNMKMYDIHSYVTSTTLKPTGTGTVPHVSDYYYSNPIIKYIHIIISHIFYTLAQYKDKISSPYKISSSQKLDSNKVYKVCAFFIYKYINFIVNQGKAIVTTLEHLKFFFLSKNNKVDAYDKTAPMGGKFKDSSVNLLTDSALYNINTSITTKLQINEQVNIGNMDAYQFIKILIELSGGNIKDLTSNNPDGNRFSLTLTSNVQKAIFVMLTNIKIFRDNNDDDQLFDATIPSHKQICTASIDTAKFADSIASTATISTTKIETSTKDTELRTLFKFNNDIEDKLNTAMAQFNPSTVPIISTVPSSAEKSSAGLLPTTEEEKFEGFEDFEDASASASAKVVHGGGNISNEVSNLHYNLTNRKKTSLKKKNKKHYESRLLKQMTKTNV